MLWGTGNTPATGIASGSSLPLQQGPQRLVNPKLSIYLSISQYFSDIRPTVNLSYISVISQLFLRYGAGT